MRGTDHALLDPLGRITGGVMWLGRRKGRRYDAFAVLRRCDRRATLPDLPNLSQAFGAHHQATLRNWFGKQGIPRQAPKNSTIPFPDLSIRSEE